MFTRRAFLIAAPALVATLPAARADGIVSIDRFYELGRFSPFATERDGRPIAVEGFMAPPLTAQSTFFVLAAQPMSVCPFCDAETEWPDSILAVYAKRVVAPAPFFKPIRVDGVFRLGEFTDPETGFVSLARIEDASFTLI